RARGAAAPAAERHLHGGAAGAPAADRTARVAAAVRRETMIDFVASRRVPRLGVGAVLLLAGVLLTPAARALPPECPTYFPALRCGRHGGYDGFVPPMMHPYLFEDPFITTGINAVGSWHEFPGDSILDGGHLWAGALQARIAITDRIAFIATRDGWVHFEPGLDLLDDNEGFADL